LREGAPRGRRSRPKREEGGGASLLKNWSGRMDSVGRTARSLARVGVRSLRSNPRRRTRGGSLAGRCSLRMLASSAHSRGSATPHPALRIHPLFEGYHGRGDWIRTSDPLLPKQMRYQAAPRPDGVKDTGGGAWVQEPGAQCRRRVAPSWTHFDVSRTIRASLRTPAHSRPRP
jgi:hypothetical protein